MRASGIVLVLAIAVVGQALTPTSYLTPADIDRLRVLFSGARPYGEDMESVYYSILGISLVDEVIPDAQSACNAVKKNVDVKSVDSLFYATQTASILKSKGTSCQVSDNSAKTMLTDSITEEATSQTIYHAVTALNYLGGKVIADQVTTALTGALKKDESPISHAYAFLAAAQIKGDLKKFHDLIEDVVAQADEVDDLYLQLEGGLFATAMAVDGAYKLSAAAKKAPTITAEKVIKFTNFLVSRRHVQQVKSAAALLSAVKTLTANDYHVPVVVSLVSPTAVSAASKTVQVRVSDLLGGSLGKLTVTAESAKNLADGSVVLSRQVFTANTKDSSVYDLDLMKNKPARGFYKVAVNIVPQKKSPSLVALTGASVVVKVTTQVAVENMELGVGDKDQSTAAKTTKLVQPNKAANSLEADHQQKLVVRFQLKDKSSGDLLTVHQAFMRLTNQQTKQEIIFIAEPDAAASYKFEMDVGANAKDFGYVSGRYSLELIVGDAVIENPFTWILADVDLSFQEGSVTASLDADRYKAKPAIKHMFRQPDARPSKTVSLAFTFLCIAPVLILLIGWLKIGINAASFPLSLSAIGFHLGLAGIYGLYYLYWVQLNMFDTLRYLGLLAIPTMICGQQLLSGIASKRK